MDCYIFIINLNTSIDRRNSMIKKISNIRDFNIYIDMTDNNGMYKIENKNNSLKSNKAINLYFNFFDATKASEISNGKLIIQNYKPYLTKIIRGKELSSSEIACFNSHYRLWEKCIQMDAPIIILEDDINFEKEFFKIADLYNSNFPYIRMMYLFDKKIRHLYGNFYFSFDKLSGTQGYYITPYAAKRFIKYSKYYFHCVDNFMDMFFIHGVFNIIYKPFMISEDPIDSIKSNINRNSFNVNKISREIVRFYLFVIKKNLFILFNFNRILKLKKFAKR